MMSALHALRPARPRPRAWASALVVFSGPEHDNDLANHLRRQGIHATVIDTRVGGIHHDVLRNGLGKRLELAIQRGDFDAVFIATPCSSYSVAHRPQLRSRGDLRGLRTAPSAWRLYLNKHDELAALSARLIRAADHSSTPWALENPADRGDRDSHAWWPKYASHAPIWLMEPIRKALLDVGAHSFTFAQCNFQAPVQKYTTIACSSDLATPLRPLADLHCRHGHQAHASQAHGLAPDGTSRAAAAAAYPPAMNAFIADAIASCVREGIDAARTPSVTGGQVADGRRLGTDVRELCEVARRIPPRFASLRNRRPTPSDQLAREPMPELAHADRPRTIPWHVSAPGANQQPLPSSSAPHSAVKVARPSWRKPPGHSINLANNRAEASSSAAAASATPVAVADLFIGDLYEEVVLAWLRHADRAVAAMRSGQQVHPPPPVRITQDQMQPWARGIVWDCADPTDCKPVVRSTRRTVFPGSRQIDRPALRDVAARLHWHDHDIVDQAGEGGIESRSDVALDTTLDFHHLGLRMAAAEADAIVQKDMDEEWVDRPLRHLPFVPCRLTPRNFIYQERSKLVDGDDGSQSLQTYQKGRITSDLSNGGDDSVNAGVPSFERYVHLPTIQQHARALGICETAGGGRCHASSYVVDAESAFRFCPMQIADLWQQCFLWWDADGRAGFCVDRRLVFGGAFSPNRFERISTLVAAHIRSIQVAFDRYNQPPPPTLRWMATRRGLQQEGLLPKGEGQIFPRHIQVYIDDFIGTTIDDEVPGGVGALPHIQIPPDVVVAEGGTPSAPGTRVYVHAQLAVQGLYDVGLSASPGKVVVGDPVTGLGFKVARDRSQISCPEVKRASILADMARQRALAVDLHVERRPAHSLVGRLGNLSQIFPEVTPFLHGGFALVESSWSFKGGRRKPPNLHLADGRPAQTNWLTLLDVGTDLLTANVGVHLAPEWTFPGMDVVGVLTSTTDASGNDGVGGYVFAPDDPNSVWLVSERWPSDILAALLLAAAVGAAPAGAATFSMPAAELFGALAVPLAVAAARRDQTSASWVDGVWADLPHVALTGPIQGVYAIGDCSPAVHAINAATSGTTQMRKMLRMRLAATDLWLGVDVPREANVDADRLSHPDLLDAVAIDAAAAGLNVRRARISDAMWDQVRESWLD